MTTPRFLLWCLPLVGAVGVGATLWALAPRTPEGTRAARQVAPRPLHSEERASAARPRVEHVERREPRVESLMPPPVKPQSLIRREATPTADAGPPAPVAGPRSGAPSELSNEATHDVIPGATRGAGHPRIEQAPDDTLPHEPAQEERPAPRRVEVAAFRAWQQPGLCAKPEAASHAHGGLMRRFRVVDGEGSGRLYVDPRVPVGAESSLLVHLEAAERETRDDLGLTAPSPEVFVYHDLELLLAAACTNEEVVAYYDGALHVVLNRDDVRESVIHEYTHHALMTNGVIGPAWAQEGIAMHVANETWWRTRQWLERVADRPFSIDVMEREIPYTLSSEQAVLFYVQAGAMVACAAREDPEGLEGLARALRESHSGGELSYDLDAPTTPASLRACVGRLLSGTP